MLLAAGPHLNACPSELSGQVLALSRLRPSNGSPVGCGLQKFTVAVPEGSHHVLSRCIGLALGPQTPKGLQKGSPRLRAVPGGLEKRTLDHGDGVPWSLDSQKLRGSARLIIVPGGLGERELCIMAMVCSAAWPWAPKGPKGWST